MWRLTSEALDVASLRKEEHEGSLMSALNPYAPGGSGISGQGVAAANGTAGQAGVNGVAAQTATVGIDDPYGPTPHLETPKPQQTQMVFPGTDDPALLYVFSSPGYTSPKPQVNSVATAAAWCGCFSLLFIPAFIAVILGTIGLVQSTSMNGVGRKASTGAIGAGIVGIVFWVLAWMLAFSGLK